jgi:membrane protease YdiL (CAAX protease family)
MTRRAFLILALAALFVASPVSGRAKGEWVLHQDGPFVVAYRENWAGSSGPARVERLAERLNATAVGVAALLERKGEFPEGTAFRVVVGPRNDGWPAGWAGADCLTVDPDSDASVDQVAAASVLSWASGAERVTDYVASGVASLVNRGEDETRAAAAALDEKGRLASLLQLTSWWPSLPLGREQLASLVGYVREQWGPPGLLRLAHSDGDLVSDADAVCREALGVGAAQLDQGWVAAVRAHAATLAPDVLDAGRDAVSAALARAVWTMRLLATLVIALGAFAVWTLTPPDRRRQMVWCLAAFAAMAGVELALFSLPVGAATKSAVALAEVLAMGLVLVAWVRRGRKARGAAAPAGVGEPASALEAPAAGARPSVWAELAIVVLLSVMIMAPRLGLYWYSREIWAKAPMIVLVLGLVFWTEGGGLGSVGLKRMGLGRLVWVTVVGVVAFRLTTGLTELIFYSGFADVTGVQFAWQYYEPWWRGIGFHHWPYQSWAGWQTAVDVWDFVFGNFAEELFFRGYLLSRLERTMGWTKALIVQALLFGLFHVNYDLFPFELWPMVGYVFMAAAFGVLMGLLVRYSRTLVVAALVHPMSNLGVLWVGAQYAGYHGGWLGFLAYYPLQIVLGLIFIPALLAAATGTFRWPDWLRPPARRPRGPYIETPG